MASEDETVCRLCFANKDIASDVTFSNLKKHLPFLGTFVVLSLDNGIPHSICSNCEHHIETTKILRKRCQFTDNIWTITKNISSGNGPSKEPINCDTGILLSCHLCIHSSNHETLQDHILSQHGADHVSGCDLCRALLGNRYERMIIKPEMETEPVAAIEEVFVGLEGDETDDDTYDQEADDYSMHDDDNGDTDDNEEDESEIQDEAEIPSITTPVSQKKPKTQECRVCGKILARKDALFRHIRTQHPGVPPEEPVIQEDLTASGIIVFPPGGPAEGDAATRLIVMGHVHFYPKIFPSKTPGITSVICPICEKILSRFDGFRRHISNRHADIFDPKPGSDTMNDTEMQATVPSKNFYKRFFPCQLCDHSLSRFDALQRHMMKCHSNPFCFKCLTIFDNEQELQEHLDKSDITVGSEMDLYPCDKCDKKLESLCKQKIHLYSHIGNYCKNCDLLFNTRKELEEHRKVNNEGQKHTCSSCGECFESRAELASHRNKMHGQQKEKTLCGVCGVFVTSHMKDHLLMHQRIRPYKCTFPGCEKRFNRPMLLKLHRRIHNKARDYACDICGMRFKMRRTLWAHVNTHNKEKKHKCHIGNCDRSFHQKFDLDLHLRRHTGHKPFECNECHETFYTNSLLKKHQQSCSSGTTITN